jgi:hypothetical protein
MHHQNDTLPATAAEIEGFNKTIGGESATEDGVAVVQGNRLKARLWKRHPGENNERRNQRIARVSPCAVHDGGQQTIRCSGRLKGRSRAVYHRIWTVHCRKEKDHQNTDNYQHNHPSAAAKDH